MTDSRQPLFVFVENITKALEASPNAFVFAFAFTSERQNRDVVLTELLATCANLLTPTEGFHHLLRAEGNQNADDDDAHLAHERAPAMQGLG